MFLKKKFNEKLLLASWKTCRAVIRIMALLKDFFSPIRILIIRRGRVGHEPAKYSYSPYPPPFWISTTFFQKLLLRKFKWRDFRISLGRKGLLEMVSGLLSIPKRRMGFGWDKKRGWRGAAGGFGRGALGGFGVDSHC